MSELRQLGMTYIDGQRAEARWKTESGAVQLDQLDRLASTADELLRFTMEFLLGWQRVDYERCVTVCVFLITRYQPIASFHTRPPVPMV